MRYSTHMPKVVVLSVIAIGLFGQPLAAQERPNRPPMGTPDHPQTATALPETTPPTAEDATKPIELIKAEREPQMASPTSENVPLPSKQPPMATPPMGTPVK
jgi:hypothetical protein